MNLSEYHPLDQVSIRLETAVSETPEGRTETFRMLADYLGLPELDFERPDIARARAAWMDGGLLGDGRGLVMLPARGGGYD